MHAGDEVFDRSVRRAKVREEIAQRQMNKERNTEIIRRIRFVEIVCVFLLQTELHNEQTSPNGEVECCPTMNVCRVESFRSA